MPQPHRQSHLQPHGPSSPHSCFSDRRPGQKGPRSLSFNAGSARPLLLILLVLAAGVVTWMGSSLFSDGSERNAVGGGAEPGGPEAARPLAGDSTQDPSFLQPALNADEDLAVTGEIQSVREPRTSRRTELKESDVVWVEGRVLLPDGTPLDEKVFVESRERGGLGEPRDRDQIDAKGKFRVAFSKDTSVGWLRVLGRYVWYPGSLSLRPGKTPEEELQLEVILGGRLEGRLLVEGNAQLPPGDLELVLSGTTDNGEHYKRRKQVKFNLERDEGGQSAHFSGDAVPPGLYQLICTPEGFLSKVVEEFRVSAGETTQVDLELVPVPAITGRVLDPDGEPVSDVDLWVGARGDESELVVTRRTAKSDEQGRFSLQGVRPGPVQLTAEAEGFVNFDEEFEMPDSLEGESREISLSYGRTLSGRVIYADGKPAPGARVTAKAPVDSNFRSTFQDENSHSTEADSEGLFFLSALGDGPFDLLSSTPQPEGTGYFVAVTEGVEADSSEVILTLGPGFAVSGRVVDLSGKPLKRFALSVRPEGFFAFLRDPNSVGVISQRVRDKKGLFKVEGLLPGSWDFNIVAGGYAMSEKVKLKLPPAPAELEIAMFELSTVKGLVLGPDGQPVAKASVRYRKDSGGMDMNSFGSKKSNRRGQFRFGGVSPGTIRVSASADGYAPSEDLEVEITREVSVDGLILRLGLGATISGVVQGADGGPATNAKVSWRNTERGKRGSAAVDEEGRFRIAGIPAGPIKLSAMITHAGTTGTSNGTRTISVERELAEGDVWTPVLRDEAQPLSPTLVVVHRNGEPWPGARVTLTLKTEGPGWSTWGKTDQTGTTHLELPGQGQYDFALNHGSSQVHGTCEVDGSGKLLFELSLGTLEGHVSVQTDKTPFYVSVMLKPANEGDETYELSTQSIKVDEDGAFHEEAVLAGNYKISATGPTSEGVLLYSEEQAVHITGKDQTTSVDLVLDQEREMGSISNVFEGF